MWKTTRILTGVAFAAALVLGACEGRQDETGEMTEAIEETGDTDLSADVEETGEKTAFLESRGASGVTGTIAARRLDGRMKIEVTLDGAEASAVYVGHVHRGTCGEPGASVASLELFEHTPGGATRSETTLDASRLTGSDHFVQIHGSEQAVIACGSLPAISAKTR